MIDNSAYKEEIIMTSSTLTVKSSRFHERVTTFFVCLLLGSATLLSIDQNFTQLFQQGNLDFSTITQKYLRPSSSNQ